MATVLRANATSACAQSRRREQRGPRTFGPNGRIAVSDHRIDHFFEQKVQKSGQLHTLRLQYLRWNRHEPPDFGKERTKNGSFQKKRAEPRFEPEAKKASGALKPDNYLAPKWLRCRYGDILRNVPFKAHKGSVTSMSARSSSSKSPFLRTRLFGTS